MKRFLCTALIALAYGVLVPSPASSQLWFYPDYALPTAGPEGATWFSGAYGRGLNDASGKLDNFVGQVGYATDRASLLASYGYITTGGESESTFAGSLAVDLNTGDGPRFAVQGGAGWMGDSDLNLFRFPVGLSIKQTFEAGSTEWTPWLMPRANIMYASGGSDSATETDLGASAGVYLTTASGFGLHAAFDALFVENANVYQLGLGAHYWLGSR
jgi:hypothetical protein